MYGDPELKIDMTKYLLAHCYPKYFKIRAGIHKMPHGFKFDLGYPATDMEQWKIEMHRKFLESATKVWGTTISL